MSTGLVISVPGVDWSNKNLGILLAVPDGAEYFAKFNSPEDLTKNLVPGKSPAALAGLPVIQHDGGAAFSRNVNYLTLGLFPANWSAYTVIAVARAPAVNNARWCPIVGNWGANSVQGGGGFLALESTDKDFRLRARSSNSPLIQPTISGISAGSLFTAGMVASESKTEVYRLMNGELSKDLSTQTASRGWGDKPLYVGHTPGEVNTVEIVIHACAVYSRALEQSEFEAVSNQLMALAGL
ncbi:hypothetical protein [Serratia proteamaculans]